MTGAMGVSSPDLGCDVSDSLVNADDLVRDGRGLEAIPLLTEANRVHRHQELDRNLVAVRDEVFPPACERSGPPTEEIKRDPTTLPLALTDPRELGAATGRRGLAQHGYVFVGFSPPRTIARARSPLPPDGA
jgi:hypothetical protein